jgi:hypothetical protein
LTILVRNGGCAWSFHRASDLSVSDPFDCWSSRCWLLCFSDRRAILLNRQLSHFTVYRLQDIFGSLAYLLSRLLIVI